MSSTSTAATSKKRKSDTTSAASTKKAKLSVAAQAQTVESILSDSTNFDLPEGIKATREAFVKLAEYARILEEEVKTLKPKERSPAEIAASAAKLADAACKGIKKQMGWKPSCQTGTAKFTYDGVCQDPLVFGKMMGIDGAPTFKAKKFTVEEFEGLIGRCVGSVRYASLYLKSAVNVQWDPTEGTFKFSGTYGK